jgi:phosphoserine phosphatase
MTAPNAPAPLVVDLDGTLLRSDMLLESFFSLLGTYPLDALAAPFQLLKGKAAFKHWLAQRAGVDVTLLPYSAAVMEEIASARKDGCQVWLVSASDEIWLHRIAEHLECFDGVIGSDGVHNLNGKAKAEALVARFGVGGFDYLGDSYADVPVWEKARRVLVAHPIAKFMRQAKGKFPSARQVGTPPRAADRISVLRPWRWWKNLLVFAVPVIARRFDQATLMNAAQAFIAVTLVVAALYVFNDLVDLGRDRRDPARKDRALASGKVPPQEMGILIPILLAGALIACNGMPGGFFAVLGGIAGIGVLYTVVLRRDRPLAVAGVVINYGLRALAGAVATEILHRG